MGRHKQVNGQFIPACLAIRHDILKMIYLAPTESLRLPSAIQLAKKHNVSRTTVTNELKKLTDAGWIIGKPGVGTFSNPHNPLSNRFAERKKIIGMLVGDTWHLMSDYTEWTIFAHAGFELLPDIGHPKNITLSTIEPELVYRELSSSVLDGMIWLFPPENYREVIQKLQNDGKAVVTLYDRMPEVPCIEFDHKKIGEDIAALALKENVRKIVWFTLEDPNSENALRGCENFGREHAGNDLQITVFDKRYDCLELFEQMLEKGDIPDAVFVHQGDFLFAIRSILEKYALTEKVLVATSGANVRKDKNFRGIVYKNDFQKMGQLAADCIRLLLNGEKEQVPLKTVLTSEVSRIS